MLTYIFLFNFISISILIGIYFSLVYICHFVSFIFFVITFNISNGHFLPICF